MIWTLNHVSAYSTSIIIRSEVPHKRPKFQVHACLYQLNTRSKILQKWAKLQSHARLIHLKMRSKSTAQTSQSSNMYLPTPAQHTQQSATPHKQAKSCSRNLVFLATCVFNNAGFCTACIVYTPQPLPCGHCYWNEPEKILISPLCTPWQQEDMKWGRNRGRGGGELEAAQYLTDTLSSAEVNTVLWQELYRPIQ